MTAEALKATVEAFFASYRSAFEQGDVAALVEHFGEVVHVASDTGRGVHVACFAGPQWRGVLEQLVAQYRRLEVERAEVRTLAAGVISTRLLQARVDWRLHNRAGDVLYDFSAQYTLVCDGPTCRIVAIAHDEQARARGAAGAQASDD